MARKMFTCLICAALVFTTLACQFLAGQSPLAFSASTATPAPTTDTVATIAAEADAAGTATVMAGAAIEAQAATQTADAYAKAARDAAALSATQTASAIATEKAQKAQPSSTEAAKATEQADTMFQRAKALEAKGLIKGSQGKFYPIASFHQDWAQLGWYQWWNTGYQPADFILQARTAWESASKTADWYASGCGFVFRARDEKNHYMIYLALDGNIYLKGYVNGQYRELGKGYAGKTDHLKGEADVTLVAQGERILYYVNGTKVLDKTAKELKQGDLALTIVSGTNQDFGTRCAVTNIELWDLTRETSR